MEENKDKLNSEHNASTPEKNLTPQEIARDAAVEELGSAFHEEWRKTRLNEDGTYEPREKKTTDQAWIEKYGTDTVDIANSTFAELPSDWKAENAAAAEVVVDILQGADGAIPEVNIDPETGEVENDHAYMNIGETIHQAWLDRNAWAKGGDLDVPFAQLPRDEQEKDIAQIRTAIVFAKNDNELAYSVPGATGPVRCNKYGYDVV